MRIAVYPADRFGCGMFRLAWPAQALQAAGHDVKVTFPDQRWDIGAQLDRPGGKVIRGVCPPDADVIVVQRCTHRYLVDALPHYQAMGKRVVVDIDDDLSCIHPDNPAWAGLRPDPGNAHSWANLVRAAEVADVVTVSTPALAVRYRADAIVLPNCLPDAYFGLPRVDSTGICWPASLASHPNDAQPLGPTLDRVLRETGAALSVFGKPADLPAYRRAFGLRQDPVIRPFVDIEDWPGLLAGIGIGIAPLADTVFNRSKSWLKLLELSAVGVPWVASDRADYRRFRDATGAGILVDRPSGWRAALKRLVADQGFRAEQSQAGRAAAEQWRIRDHAWRWAEAWEGPLRGARPAPRAIPRASSARALGA